MFDGGWEETILGSRVRRYRRTIARVRGVSDYLRFATKLMVFFFKLQDFNKNIQRSV